MDKINTTDKAVKVGIGPAGKPWMAYPGENITQMRKALRGLLKKRNRGR
jgi:hypothetical protein